MCAEMLKEYLKANCMGRKNTVSGASLERTLHLSGNELRRYVNRLRCQGIPIASSRDGKWGPHASPAKRVAWGEEARRSERAFGASRKRGIRSPRRRYAANAGEVYATIRQLKQMESGLNATIGGLERALEQFGGGDAS